MSGDMNVLDIMDAIINAKEIGMSTENKGGQSIFVKIEDTKKEFSLALKGEEVFLVYSKDTLLTEEYLLRELERHKKLLELAEKFNRDQQRQTNTNIESTSKIQRVLELVPEGAKRTHVILGKTIVGVLQLLSFQSPNVGKTYRFQMAKQALSAGILSRIIREIEEQRELYFHYINEVNREIITSLVKTMDDILYLLKIVLNSKKNELNSDLDMARLLEIM